MRRLPMTTTCAIWATVSLLVLAQPATAQGQARLLEVRLAGGVEAGVPIHWDKEFALLLKPSGAMLEFDVADVHSHRMLDEVFVPQTLTAARGVLQTEMGANFETATVGPYVLCAPRGRADRWRERFRVLLAGYSRYF
ncbi:MAG: hypothetical protein IT423_09515 [Pirellulaceae bacterium]|nr:hypothetical protein [Pirellulaceae bacterium]